MGFRLQKAACFAQGAWNIYILQPDWLNRKDVWSVPDPLLIETLRIGPGFRYSSEDSPIRWVVTPFRVTVETRSANENVGPVLARLLRALPETPINGIGSSFSFRGPVEDVAAVLPNYRSETEGEPVLGWGTSLLVQVAGVRYGLELIARSENRQADLSVLSIPALSEECGEAELVPHLEAFAKHRRTAQQLAMQYWKVAFDET